MNKKLKGLIIGSITTTMLMGSISMASDLKTNIDVLFNYVNLKVNGEMVDSDTVLYQGTTYVPLRSVSEMLDKNVDWDQETQTAMISDKIIEDDDYKNEQLEKLGIIAYKIDDKYYNLSHHLKVYENAIENLYVDDNSGIYALNDINSIFALTAFVKIYNNHYESSASVNPTVNESIRFIQPYSYSEMGQRLAKDHIPVNREGFEFEGPKTHILTHFIFYNYDSNKSYNLTMINGRITDKYRNMIVHADEEDESLNRFPTTVMSFKNDNREYINIGDILKHLGFKYKIYDDKDRGFRVVEIIANR